MTLNLIDQPLAPGLTLRPYRGPEDVPAIVRVHNASEAADQVEETITEAETLNTYTHADDFDPRADVLLAEAAGAPVAYTRLFQRDTAEGERVFWSFAYVLPEWRRRGLGAALAAWVEARARAIDRVRPFPGPRHLQVYVEDTALGKQAVLRAAGYQPFRYSFFMRRTDLHIVPEAGLPPGLVFRAVTPADLPALWEAKEDAFRDHWGYAPKSPGVRQAWLTDPEHDLSLWQAVWEGNTAVGVSCNRISAEDNAAFGFLRGWIDTLGVRRPWRGRGVARAMLARGLRVLRERGMTEAVLGVDAENPTGALGLYRSVGFAVLNQDVIYRKTLTP